MSDDRFVTRPLPAGGITLDMKYPEPFRAQVVDGFVLTRAGTDYQLDAFLLNLRVAHQGLGLIGEDSDFALPAEVVASLRMDLDTLERLKQDIDKVLSRNPHQRSEERGDA